MILDWTDWTFWLITAALVAFGFNVRVLYEQWYFRKVRNEVRDEVREVRDLTLRLQAATERQRPSCSPATRRGGWRCELRQAAGADAARRCWPDGAARSPWVHLNYDNSDDWVGSGDPQ
jgi:hypothetical protein